MKFRDYFKNTFGTSDNHEESSLRSHYYRARLDETKEAIKQLVLREKATIIDENDVYKEILFETRSYSCVAKITDVTPVEMAIDFNINTFSLIAMGKGKKLIEEFYSFLDTKLSFKGTGLYKG